MPYTPDFKIVHRDRATWLMDREQTVLCFDTNLVKIGAGRLTPGGYEMFSRPGMIWGPYGWFSPYWGFQIGEPKLESFQAQAEPAKAVLTISVLKAKGAIRSDWILSVSYDRELASYAYNVTATATVIRDLDAATYSPFEWEYFDLFPQGCFDAKTGPEFAKDGQPVEFPAPMWGYIWYQRMDVSDMFAQAPTWVKVPLSRVVVNASNRIRVARDGYLGFANNPVGNPMVQLLDDTAAVTEVTQCNWFYDLHFMHTQSSIKAAPPKGFTQTVRFRIVNFNPATTAPHWKRTVLSALYPVEREQKRYPVYEEAGLNSFERLANLEAPEHGRMWQPFNRYNPWHRPDQSGVMRVDYGSTPDNFCRWVGDVAHTGTGSVMAATAKPGIAGWQLSLFDRPRVQEGRRYRLSVYIRTKDLEGPGATLGYFQADEEKTYSWSGKTEAEKRTVRPPHLADTWVKGTSEWTRVELVTEPMRRQKAGKVLEYDLSNCLIQPVLWHEGQGTTWFDDFLIEPAE